MLFAFSEASNFGSGAPAHSTGISTGRQTTEFHGNAFVLSLPFSHICIQMLLLRKTTAMLLAGCILTLAGCAGAPPQVGVAVTATETINRDDRGHPLSVVVLVYQLNARTRFDRLTVDQIAGGRPDGDLFGNELVARTEKVVVPGSEWQGLEALDPSTRFIGVMALFRAPDVQHWRFIVDAASARAQGLDFVVADCFLRVTRPEPLLIPGQSPTHVPRCGLTPSLAERG